MRGLLEAQQGQLAAQHIAAAFNALAEIKHADRMRGAEQLLHQLLLPALEDKLDEAEAAVCSQGSCQAKQGLDSKSCAVILQSMSLLHTRKRLALPSSIGQRLMRLFLQPELRQQAIPQGISMVAAAAAKLRLNISEMWLARLLQALLMAAERGVHRLTPMNVSQTLWGVATVLAATSETPPRVSHCCG